MLSQERINQLAAILEADFGVQLKPEEVFAVGQGLVGFFDHLMRFDHKDKNENENHEKEGLHKTV